MSIILSTATGNKNASKRWNRTFVFYGRVILDDPFSSVPKNERKPSLIIMAFMYTRVDTLYTRLWRESRVHKQRLNQIRSQSQDMDMAQAHPS